MTFCYPPDIKDLISFVKLAHNFSFLVKSWRSSLILSLALVFFSQIIQIYGFSEIILKKNGNFKWMKLFKWVLTEGIWDRPFSTYATFSRKLTFLTPLIRTHAYAYREVGNVYFFSKICVLIKLMQTFTCSKSRIETLEKDMKYVQS